MTLHRKKPKMARAWYRLNNWDGLPIPKLNFMRGVHACYRWHRAVSNFGGK